MKIEFELSKEDQLQFVMHMRMSSKTLRRETRMLCWGMLVLLSVLAVLTALNEKVIVSGVLWAAGFAFFFGYPSVVLWYVRLLARKMESEGTIPAPTGSCQLEFLESGVYAKTQYAQSKFQWPAFVKFEVTTDFFYLYTHSGGIYLIPKSACNQWTPEEFEATVRRYWQQSKDADQDLV